MSDTKTMSKYFEDFWAATGIRQLQPIPLTEDLYKTSMFQ